MFEGPVAQRSLALFVAGWLLLSFPLLGLWDVDVTVLGLPLFPLALFAGWALLIGALAWLAERGDEAEPELATRHAADAARRPADAPLPKPPEPPPAG